MFYLFFVSYLEVSLETLACELYVSMCSSPELSVGMLKQANSLPLVT